MCEPATLATLSSVASIAGTALSTIGAIEQAQAQKDAAEYNAKVAEYAAQDAQQRGEQEAMKARQQASQLRGAQRTTMASRGLDLGVGTPMALLDQTDYFAETDQNTIRNNAAKEAWSKRAQAQGFRNEASSINPMMSGASTLLTGAGNVASQWYKFSGDGLKFKGVSWS